MQKKLLKDEQSLNKQKILKAAIEVFINKGYLHTTIREITKRSKLSNGTIYFYFKNKEEILKEVLQKIELIAMGTLLENGKCLKPQELLNNINVQLTNTLAKNYELLLFSINTSHVIPKLGNFFYEQFKQKTQELADTFKRLIENGQIRKMDPEKAAIFTLGYGFSMVLLKEGILRKNLEDNYYDEMHKFILDIFVNGLFAKK